MAQFMKQEYLFTYVNKEEATSDTNSVATKPKEHYAFQLTPNQLLYQQKRFRGKINIRKPKIFFKKAVVNELVTPFFINPNEGKSLEELCLNRQEVDKSRRPLGPLERIIARELREYFDNSKMVACVHVNSMPARELFEVQVPLHRAKMTYKQYGTNIVLGAIKDSPFDGIAPLLCGRTALVFSPEINVPTLQKILRNSKKMFTLGGILEGHVVTYDEFLRYGEMDITSAQMGLVQLLQNAGGVNLTRQLTHHQSTLVSRLKQIGANETTSTNEATPDGNE